MSDQWDLLLGLEENFQKLRKFYFKSAAMFVYKGNFLSSDLLNQLSAGGDGHSERWKDAREEWGVRTVPKWVMTVVSDKNIFTKLGLRPDKIGFRSSAKGQQGKIISKIFTFFWVYKQHKILLGKFDLWGRDSFPNHCDSPK